MFKGGACAALLFAPFLSHNIYPQVVMTDHQDTIVAQATAPGQGGVGIVRVSGPLASTVAEHVLGKVPKTRYAEYLGFKDSQHILDQGIALFFQGLNFHRRGRVEQAMALWLSTC